MIQKTVVFFLLLWAFVSCENGTTKTPADQGSNNDEVVIDSDMMNIDGDDSTESTVDNDLLIPPDEDMSDEGGADTETLPDDVIEGGDVPVNDDGEFVDDGFD